MLLLPPNSFFFFSWVVIEDLLINKWHIYTTHTHTHVLIHICIAHTTKCFSTQYTHWFRWWKFSVITLKWKIESVLTEKEPRRWTDMPKKGALWFFDYFKLLRRNEKQKHTIQLNTFSCHWMSNEFCSLSAGLRLATEKYVEKTNYCLYVSCVSPCECKAFCWIYTSVFHAHIQCVEPHTQHTEIQLQSREEKRKIHTVLICSSSLAVCGFVQFIHPAKQKKTEILKKNNNTPNQFNS